MTAMRYSEFTYSQQACLDVYMAHHVSQVAELPPSVQRAWYLGQILRADLVLTPDPQLEWLWANCKIVYWQDGTPPPYPYEHNPHEGKDMRKMIEGCMVIPNTTGGTNA